MVLNFYHASLELLKHMSNIREKIMESLVLPKIEKAGGLLPGENIDDLTLPSGDFGDMSEYAPPSDDVVTISEEPSNDYAQGSDEATFDDGSTSELPPPDGSDDTLLTPDSYTENAYTEQTDPADYYTDDEEIPPPPPPGSYGDGSDYVDDGDDFYNSGGSEVEF